VIDLITTMATKAVVGRGLREAGAALKHASGLEVCVICLDVSDEVYGHFRASVRCLSSM